MSSTRVTLRCVIALLGLVSFCQVLLAQSAIQYVYDELGRLVGVIDASGNAAAYSYDAVGNILSIAQYSSSQASVLQFTPTSGPVGTTVTIYGTGISSTISNDSVSFHGTSATITSANANQIVTTVPSGTTTGTLSITTPAGSFTTANQFTVTTSTGAPTVTSFTPTTAVPGTSITISGTNFNTTPANDQLKFNISHQFASSATSTSISATTPVGTSGHVQVVTPSGTAVSSQDLYVPFGGHTASQVGYSQRTTFGTSETVSPGGTGQIGLLIFDATVGERVSLSLSGGTFAYCYNAYLFAPDGTQLSTASCPGASGFLDAVTAPYTGTYTAGIDAGLSNSSGGVTVTPNNATDVTGTITIGGSAVTMTTTVPGQNISLSFSGSLGQAVSWLATSATFPSYANVTVYAPDGTPLGPATTVNSSGSPVFAGPMTLPQTGTYIIYIDPVSTNTGQITTTLYNSTPVTGTITAGGSPVTVTTTSPGQNGLYTFTGTTSERVSLSIQSVSYSSSYFYYPSATVSIVEPNGTTTLASTSVYPPYNFFIDVQTLPSAGTYTVMVAPGPYTGSATLTLYNVPADASGTIAIGGSAVTETTTTPGQNAQLTFSGTSGQSITLTCSSVTYSNYTLVTLYNPDGTTLTTGYAYPWGNTIFGGVSLGQTGTYKIYINPAQADTGQMTLQLTSP
jgi:YD repeat-containing protein